MVADVGEKSRTLSHHLEPAIGLLLRTKVTSSSAKDEEKDKVLKKIMLKKAAGASLKIQVNNKHVARSKGFLKT